MSTAKSKQQFLSMFQDLKKPEQSAEAPRRERAFVPEEKAIKRAEIKKRTFEINEDIWQDFALLVKSNGMTLNEAINDLIRHNIASNQRYIIEIKERRGNR